MREKPTQPLQDDASVVSKSQTLAGAEQLPVTEQPNITHGGQSLQTPNFFAPKTNPALPTTINLAPRPIVSKIDALSARPIINHLPQKFAANPIHKELTQPEAAAPATDVAHTSTSNTGLRPDPAIGRPAQTIKPSASKQEQQPETLAPKQPNSKVETNPISQPSVSHSVSDIVKSIFAAAAVSINESTAQTIVPRPETSSMPDSLSPATIARPKSEELVVSATAADLKDDKVHSRTFLLPVRLSYHLQKSGLNKTRVETTSKTKNQRTDAEIK